MDIGNNGPFGDIATGTLVAMGFTGGNDHIFGDEGRDVIAGGVFGRSARSRAGSSLHGGNDLISGGDGNGALNGDFGPAPTASLIGGHVTRTGGNDVLPAATATTC